MLNATPAPRAGSASWGNYDGDRDLDAVVLVRLIGRRELHPRLDMHHDELNGQRGRFQAVANFMSDFMAAAHRQVAVHLHVEFNNKAAQSSARS